MLGGRGTGECRGDLLALNLTPVPADNSGQPSSPCKFVGLANRAASDGSAAFPSVVTLIRYTGLFERIVRTWTGARRRGCN